MITTDDNDDRFPDESRVEVRYPRTRQQEQGDRSAWPWLPGTIARQCGPDEWQVCVQDRDVAVLRDGRRAPRNTPSRNLYYPMCFRDSSEIRRPEPAIPPRAHRLARQHADRAPDHQPDGAKGAVAVTGDKVIHDMATVAACMVAGLDASVSCARSYDLALGHGQDQVTAGLLPISTAGLAVAASLVLIHEARNRWATSGLARVMLWIGIATMAGAGIASGGKYGPLSAVISAWPAMACGGAVEMVVQFVRRPRAPSQEPRKVQERVVVPDDVRDTVRAAYEDSVRAGAPLGQKAMAVRFGLSRRKIRQLVPECTTYIEDRRRGGEAA